MSNSNAERETWSTRIGFILAAVGSAVGLGNIWRFPFQVGQNGGAAFVVMYLAFVVLIGLPAMLVEFVVGRRTGMNTVSALKEFGSPRWKYLGGLFVFIGFVLLSYYSVIGGWVLRYMIGSATGSYMTQSAGSYFSEVATGFDALALHAVFMFAVIAIVALGVKRGIEFGVKLMVPAIIAIFALLAVYGYTLDGAMDAYAYYLSPDMGYLLANWQSIVPNAAAQGFFTLSLGMGVMITYASYLSEDENLAVDGVTIIGFNTGISILTGLVVFPILFSAGVNYSRAGAGAVFISMAEAFSSLPFGRVIGILFFLTVALAALSSSISLIEVIVSYAIDEFNIQRVRATVLIGTAIFLLGAPVALDPSGLDTHILNLYDKLAANILLVIGGLLLISVVTIFHTDKALDEIEKGVGNLVWWGHVWLWIVGVPVVVVLGVALTLGIVEYVEFLRGDFIPFVQEYL